LTLTVLVPLALGTVGSACVVIARIVSSAIFEAVVAAAVLVTLLKLWFAWLMAAWRGLRTLGARRGAEAC
jgi:hypothetical protein